MVNETPVAPTGSPSVEEKRRLLVQKLQERAQRGVFPLSFSQQRLWFLHRMDPDSPAYHIPLALRARGDLDVQVLRRALRDVVQRHEALRTTFTERDGRPVQVVGPTAPDVLTRVDLRGLSPEDREKELRWLAYDAATRPFDLEHGPLLRAVAVRLDDEEWGLLFTLHHIVADGWSMGVLVRDLSNLYTAHAQGLRPELAPMGTQYPEFALWQRGWLKGGVLERETAFWREQLDGAPRLLELPTDRPRGAVAGTRAESRPFALGARTSAALHALAREEGATLFMTLMAAWQLLLGRYAGQDDVLVGTPIAGRTREELEGVVGFFVNTLVLRARLEPGLSFRRLLRQVRETTLGAYAHQHLPFERLVEELAVERSLATTPLFQAMFALQNNERTELALGDARFEALPTGTESAKFDLNLRAGEGPDGIAGVLAFRAELFDGATAERMLAQYTALLEAVAAHPDRPLSEQTLLSDGERRQVVGEWNGTARPYPETCLHRLFEAQAARTPDHVAVQHGDRAVTYAELEGAANRLAHALQRRGVGPETRVALHLENGPEQLAGILGVLKAGGAYVPLDTASPADRLAYVIQDSGAALVLADDPAALAAAGVPVLALAADAFADEPDTAPASGVGPRNLVYVIYTSGSTGRPKGVLVEHHGVCNTVVNYIEAYGITAGARSLHFAPVHFDASVTDLFTPLCAGATLVTAPREALIPGAELVELLRGQRVTHAKFTPTALAALPHADLPDLEAVMTGGEACTAELVARWAPGRRFINGYGPTETSVRVTVADVTHETRTPPIGRPVPNTRLYVLDGAGQPLPVGVPGELHIGGVGVARGYQGRPGLTARTFIPDAFSGVPGGRLYRSGDRARWLPDGQLAFAGRVDFQVKVRGIRIEPGEIEAALREQPGVADTVVVAREDRLVGYVVPAAGATLSASALRDGLKGRLPEYMVPAAFVVLDALPRGSSGKTDRRALPAPDFGAEAEAYVHPRTPAEEILAGLFTDVLRMEPVGARDDFFALGGHSLLATRLISRIRQAFGVELPLRALFEASTVEGLAARVEALGAGGDERLAPPVVPVPRDGTLPLSFAQQRLWFLDQLQPGGAAYNVPRAVRLSGALDVSALERALTEIVRRHETLRTRFPSVGGEPAQVIETAAPMGIAVEDLSHLPADEREAEARRMAADEARAPFDLARGPLLRARLLRLAEDDHALLFTLHHAVSDGWSTGILVREVSALYDAFARGAPSPLTPLPVQYADFAAWQRAWLAGDVLETQLGYWRTRLAGAPPLLDLPTDRPRASVPSDRGASVSFALSAETVGALRALSRREGATMFMTLLAAWQLLLARYSGQDDVSVGTPVAGRTRLETEGLIGFFVNTLVLRTDLSGAPSFRALLGRVREATLGAHQHQEVPFEKLVEELAPERSLSHTPLFQAMFVLQNNALEALRLGELHAAPFAADAESAKFDLTLALAETDDAVAGSLTYRAELWDAATMERMAAHFAALVEAAAAQPERSVAELAFLADTERAQLAAWNDTERAYDLDASLHGLFEAQAARTPDAVAVQLDDETLTYAGLDARANQLARHLRGLGVGAETRVGVCAERSTELVVALLAVLKAGGAYVPIDPSYPADRIAYMLEDSGIPVLLTQARLADALPPHGARVVRVDADRETIAAESADALSVDVAPEQLAYVIYTSGSTGRPKGAMNAHRGIVNRLRWMQDEYRLDATDVVLQKTPFSFDVSVWEFFWPLMTGARLVLAKPGAHGDPAYLAELIASRGITTLHFVPSMLAAFVDAGVAARCTSLRRVVCSGEALPYDLVERAMDALPSAGIHNLYGPTEAAVDVTYWAAERRARRVVPIGRPVANTRIHVLDGGMNPTPAGVPGELFIGGVQVGRGYLGRPALTAETFVPDAFGAPGARLYRTGDRARWTTDGEIEYLGRVDFQVKIRGFRIEPGEVEAALRAHPAVRDAVVTVRDDAAGSARLVAYVVGGADAAALRAHLGARLPEHMVPSALVPMDALPLNTSGKVDRRALPAPELSMDAGAFVAPRGDGEEIVAGIFADVLRAGRVGAGDDFFVLGGHSLLATRVASRVRDAFGVELPLRTVFEAPTVRALAARVDALRQAGQGSAAPALVPVERTGAMPLS
ncbi:non-ribosomal peptide synthetase, partial [Longimicrobium sp.]|uniref:non-ribosomal peptide synthetase n=1 Tax=Longimicrobium sp. TaxID=2029185 RepID=UPI002E2F22F9